jgi:glycosyltransferase involved in cell wall biosynthesis
MSSLQFVAGLSGADRLMRILINLQGAELGGGQRVASQIASGLKARGHEISVLAATEGPALAWFPPLRAFHPVDLTTLRRPAAIANAARILRGYDALYSHVAVGGQLAGAIASRAAGKQHIVHQHSFVKFSNKASIGAVQRAIYPRLLANAEFIAVAPHIGRELAASGIRPDRIHVVVNGVESATTPRRTRSNGRLTVGMLSRFNPAKRIDVFIQAAALLQSADARFVVGGSREDESPYAEELRRQASAAGVEFVEPGSAVGSFLDSLDIVCIPSEHEGMPLVLLEALALGKSIVASDIPAVSDVTEESHAARLVPVGNAQALAQAVRELIADPAERGRMSDVGPGLIRTKYTIEQMVSASVRVIESCVAKDTS